MGRGDGIAERTSRRITNFFDGINATSRTSGNLALAVEFDVRRQVVGILNGFAVGLVVFQGELVGGGINLAKVIDANSHRSAVVSSGGDKIGSSNQNQKENSKN